GRGRRLAAADLPPRPGLGVLRAAPRGRPAATATDRPHRRVRGRRSGGARGTRARAVLPAQHAERVLDPAFPPGTLPPRGDHELRVLGLRARLHGLVRRGHPPGAPRYSPIVMSTAFVRAKGAPPSRIACV